ncbi:MAG: hypothetical protein RL651_298 [Pseudomonadota bacterium]|jgi:phage terminase Nu1 subunit (DNA packaging protein)
MTKELEQMLVTDRDLANLAGVSDRRIRSLAEIGVLERQGRGRYALGQAIRGLLDNAANNASELQRERTRKMAADADLAELEYAKQKNLVASIDQVERMVSSAFAQVRASIRKVPERTVAQLIGETDERRFKTVLLEEIDQALEALATGGLAEALDEFDDK